MVLRELITTLHTRAGVGSVQGNLEAVARAALECYADAVPAQAAVAPSWTPAASRGQRAHGAGAADPRRPDAALTAYLRLEQRLGRVQPDADLETAAALLLNACERRAFHQHFLGDTALGSADGFAAELVRAVMHTLVPVERRPD